MFVSTRNRDPEISSDFFLRSTVVAVAAVVGVAVVNAVRSTFFSSEGGVAIKLGQQQPQPLGHKSRTLNHPRTEIFFNPPYVSNTLSKARNVPDNFVTTY